MEEKLYETLVKLSVWCKGQSGTVLWSIMETHDNGRAGFQMLVVNHETGQFLWSLHAKTLAELGGLLAVELEWRVN